MVLKVGLGICMDLWSQYFYEESFPCELATFWRDQDCDVIWFTTAYPRFVPKDEAETKEADDLKMVERVIKAYLGELKPLLASEEIKI